MRILRTLALVILLLITSHVFGEEFYYKHREGERYRIVSTVNQDVLINRRLNHSAEIINRIAVETTGVDGETGSFRAVFQTAEKTVAVDGNETFDWSREYISEFDRDRLGYLTIGNEFFMPVVRNVPVFPDRALEPGDFWSAEGYEVHDFRDGFGIEEPYRITFWAYYVYLGTMERNGLSYPAFSVSYRINNQPPPVSGRIWPNRIQGAFDQVVYWDSELGMAAAYEEQFRMLFELSNGQTIEFIGRAEAEVIEVEPMDMETVAEEILEDILRLDIEGATVRIEDIGVTISLEDIQFLPDSAILRDIEKVKLDKLAEILLAYPDRDILVSGHTALAGTREGRDQLSLERARSVANYLIDQNVRPPDRVVIQGFGAERPLADNATEAGRQRNRRVEITLLEN